jgi:hypothetical protein
MPKHRTFGSCQNQLALSQSPISIFGVVLLLNLTLGHMRLNYGTRCIPARLRPIVHVLHFVEVGCAQLSRFGLVLLLLGLTAATLRYINLRLLLLLE